MMAGVEEPEELRCVDSAIASVIEDIDSAFILKEEQRTAIKAFVDVPSRTGDVSSTCEVAFWQIVGSTNDETSSATYGNRAAHATVDIINERSSSRNKDPASRKCASEMRLLVYMTL
ncbi:hypothetical protein DPX16_8555 [Anabarilius grahami]|uniref:Uncharacterized protein n=1 Tax=Anabarilius grahami TaxID=495550 RepID=A0A3N0Y974_ANAGA|nr:hypothetical protein DPX16_8555 [Anabarilius grahami]